MDVKSGTIMAKVKVDIGGGQAMTALISDEAVKELGVKVGDPINLLIKATSVMLGKD
jgi:molybdopterin-binding protein